MLSSSVTQTPAVPGTSAVIVCNGDNKISNIFFDAPYLSAVDVTNGKDVKIDNCLVSGHNPSGKSILDVFPLMNNELDYAADVPCIIGYPRSSNQSRPGGKWEVRNCCFEFGNGGAVNFFVRSKGLSPGGPLLKRKVVVCDNTVRFMQSSQPPRSNPQQPNPFNILAAWSQGPNTEVDSTFEKNNISFVRAEPWQISAGIGSISGGLGFAGYSPEGFNFLNTNKTRIEENYVEGLVLAIIVADYDNFVDNTTRHLISKNTVISSGQGISHAAASGLSGKKYKLEIEDNVIQDAANGIVINPGGGSIELEHDIRIEKNQFVNANVFFDPETGAPFYPISGSIYVINFSASGAVMDCSIDENNFSDCFTGLSAVNYGMFENAYFTFRENCFGNTVLAFSDDSSDAVTIDCEGGENSFSPFTSIAYSNAQFLLDGNFWGGADPLDSTFPLCSVAPPAYCPEPTCNAQGCVVYDGSDDLMQDPCATPVNTFNRKISVRNVNARNSDKSHYRLDPSRWENHKISKW